MARAGYTQAFTESDICHIVQANLRDLFVHFCDVDESVSLSAHLLILNHAFGCHPFVQQLISEAMLGVMADLLPESAEITKEASIKAEWCAEHLEWIWRALTRSQRQKWVSFLVRLLQGQKACQITLIDRLKLLWRADDDPSRSYAEADQQLKVLSHQPRCEASAWQTAAVVNRRGEDE